MEDFKNIKLLNIYEKLEIKLKDLSYEEIIEFEVINPDISTKLYSGEKIIVDGNEYIYRGYNSWINLAQKLFCKMLTPKIIDDNFVIIRYLKLDIRDNFHQKSDYSSEKYGEESIFSRINKSEEASFISYYLDNLKRVNLDKRARVLNLGINSGDEFSVIKEISENFDAHTLVGIDFCETAISKAKTKLNYENCSFYKHDINELDSLNLGKFDLIISIGTLQSASIDFKPFFMSLVQNYLEKEGAMILGFPNCRWIDTEMIYGAKAPNYNFSEMSILYNDLIFCKKYLQQKKFRVTITGKDYIFLTATSIRK